MPGFLDTVVKSGTSFLPVVGAAVAVAGSLSVLTKVESGQMAARTRFGAVVYQDGMPLYVCPGWHFRVPGWGLKIADVRDIPYDLGVLEIDQPIDGELVKRLVKASITWRIAYIPLNGNRDGCIESQRDYGHNIRRALFNTRNLDESVTNIASAAIVEVLTHLEYSKWSSEKLLRAVRENCSEKLLERYGVELLDVLVTSKSRTEAETLGDKVVKGAQEVSNAIRGESAEPVSKQETLHYALNGHSHQLSPFVPPN